MAPTTAEPFIRLLAALPESGAVQADALLASLALSPDDTAQLLVELVGCLAGKGDVDAQVLTLKPVLTHLVQKPPALSTGDAAQLLRHLAGVRRLAFLGESNIPPLIVLSRPHQAEPEVKAALLQVIQRWRALGPQADHIKFLPILSILAGPEAFSPLAAANALPPEEARPPLKLDGLGPSKLFDAFCRETRDALLNVDVTQTQAGAALLALPREAQTQAVFVAVQYQATDVNANGCNFAVKSLLSALLRKKLPFTPAQLEDLVAEMIRVNRLHFLSMLAPASIFSAIEGLTELPDTLYSRLEDLGRKLRDRHIAAEEKKLLDRLDKLLAKHSGQTAAAHFELNCKEAWTNHLQAELVKRPGQRGQWDLLLAHCNTASSSKPSQKWLRQAEGLIRSIGQDAFTEVVGSTFAQIGKPGQAKVIIGGIGEINDPTLIHDTYSDLLRGLVWCTGLVEDETLIGQVGDAADACFKKVPMFGPRSSKIGNACLHALAALKHPAAAAQLGRLKTRAKHASVKKQLGKAFDTAAEKAGLTAQELEELAVPTFGLTTVGELKKSLGDVTAWLHINDESAAELTWLKADGKPLASAPASVKKDHAAELKTLKQHEKEINQQLTAQRVRLERLFLEERTWSLADFRSRYLDHPLVGVLARRLIWRFSDGPFSRDPQGSADSIPRSGIWSDGKIVDQSGAPIPLTAATRVSLWHPIHASVAEVQAWRTWLEARELRQPFKQAHREIYVLTDAERQTGAYSNRFAAHILRQHHFSALCLQRGWRYRLQGPFDSANTPEIDLPGGWRAEFWVEGVEEGQDASIMTRGDVSHAGIFLYITTDQVRFYQGDSVVPLALAEVPPLVFSELMRDVDLFVGVCSVGNDPTWSDGGLGGFGRQYWQEYSFGKLFPTAEVRREVLERIVPRLKIADRCTLGDRFLVVKGNLRTYKIHLGSGNILMLPNDQYLCIVPDQKAKAKRGGKLYLPFEGDMLLSVIISKALLLAADDQITEPAIMNQIRNRR